MTIRLALAVNHSKNFEANHFGEAEQFLIYEWTDSQLVFRQAIANPFANMSHHQHSPAKADHIRPFLKEHEVNVLVARQFGHNVKRVNAHFIPILIGVSTLEELFPILQKQMKWIEEEWAQNAGNYKLFNLKKGTIKTTIK